MKKIILALLAVATIGTANAQKNTVLVYGNVGIASDKADNGNGNEYKSLDWNINPGVGFQFTDNITVGLQGGIDNNFDEWRNPTMDPTTGNLTGWARRAMENREWTAGAFFRYTYPVNKTFSFFTQIDLSYVSGQDVMENESRVLDAASNSVVETVTYNYDYYNGFQGTITPMVQVFIMDGFALNFSYGGLMYRTISYDTPVSPSRAAANGSIDESNFSFTWGGQFNFGVSKNIGKCCKKTGNVKPGDDLRPMNMEAGGNDDDE